MAVAQLLQAAANGQVDIRRLVGAGAPGLHPPLGEGGPRLNLQQIGGDMLRGQSCPVLRQGDGPFHRLAGGGQHQVHRKIGKPRLAGQGHPLGAFLRGVAAAQQPQALRLPRLEAQGKAAKAPLPKPPEPFFLQVSGVGLQGDFAVLQKRKAPSDRLQDLEKPIPQQVGGPAAKVDGGDRRPRRGRASLHRPHQGAGVVLPQSQIGGGVKIAVGAAALAEGDMKIKTERLLHSASFCARKKPVRPAFFRSCILRRRTRESAPFPPSLFRSRRRGCTLCPKRVPVCQVLGFTVKRDSNPLCAAPCATIGPAHSQPAEMAPAPRKSYRLPYCSSTVQFRPWMRVSSSRSWRERASTCFCSSGT